MNTSNSMYRKITAYLMALMLVVTAVIPMTFVVPAYADAESDEEIRPSDPVVTSIDDPDSEENIHTVWDCIWFGNYYQSNAETKEPIKWRVLSVTGDDAFVLADSCLDCMLYDSDPPLSNYIEYSTWEVCTLREWLNNDFCAEAFDEQEQQAIMTTTVMNPDNPFEKSRGGKTTTDKIYLPSIQEISDRSYGFYESFRGSSTTRSAANTWYAYQRGAGKPMATDEDYQYHGKWALRSPGRYPEYPYSVPTASSGYCATVSSTSGDGDQIGATVRDTKVAVRPCMHIDLSLADWSYAGTVTGGGPITDDPEEPVTTEAKTATGILCQGDGWKMLWTADYVEKSTGEKYAGELEIYLDVEDGFNEVLYVCSDTADISPWLSETGLEKSDFYQIKIKGTSRNPLIISDELFAGYSGLKEAYLTHIFEIGNGAFENCTSLEKVDGFGDDLCIIGNRAFRNCTSLTDTKQVRYTIEGWYEVRNTHYPRNLYRIGEEAFYNTVLYDMYLYDSVNSIGDNAFGECDLLTIHCNKDSYALEYAEANNLRYVYMTSVTDLGGFSVTRDAWSFSNSSDVFGKGDNYYISDEDMKKYTPRQKEIVEFKQKEWSGSCYGLAATAVLSKMGVILPGSIEAGKENLYSISAPNNDKIESTINFFHFQQYFRPYGRAMYDFSLQSEKEKLQTIKNYAEKAMEGEQPFLLTYYYPPDENGIICGHALVGFGVEHGNYQIAKTENLLEKKDYDYRIKLYNCNRPGEIQYLYCNLETGDWLFPFARGAAEIGAAVRDRDVLDVARSGLEEDHFFKSFIHTSEDPGFTLSSNGTSFDIIGPGVYGDGEVVVYSPICETPDGSQQADTLIAVVPEDKAYTVEPDGSDSGKLLCQSDEEVISLECDSFEQAEFGASGEVVLTGVTGECTLRVVQDTPSEQFGWNVSEFSAQDMNGELAVEEQNGGIMISGTGIDGLDIRLADEVSEEETSVNLTVETDQTSVLMTGMLEDVGLYTDPDSDGTYDNKIASGSGDGGGEIHDPVDPIVEPVQISNLAIRGIENKTYTGKVISQDIVIKDGEETLREGKDYALTYKNNIDPGKASVIIEGLGKYTGTITKTFTIDKAANPLSCKAKTATIKFAKLKKKSRILDVGKVLKFAKKGQGKMTYTLSSAKKGKKSFKKYIKINKITGKVTIKKGLNKGTYKVKIKVIAAGNAKYKAGSKTIILIIKIK